MTTDEHVFGTSDLTPELVRGAKFDERDGRVDATEVRNFLDRVASSLEVFLAADARTALQAEFARNAEIAKQVLDAGQSAAEQLRRQAAEEAKRILDEARDATLGLRETVDDEIEQAREQVDALRGTFIQELRDLYDRIGASLYRFEKAVDESNPSPIREPRKSVGEQFTELSASVPGPVASPPLTPAPVPVPVPTPVPASAPTPPPAAPPVPMPDDLKLPDGAKPPAWQQLPAEAYGEAPAPAPAPEPAPEQEPASVTLEDPFAVEEDEPLAPGEPLVDLREMSGGVTLDPAEEPDAIDSGGSWLDLPSDGDADEASASAPDLEHDDALAEALISSAPPASQTIAAPVLGEEPPPVPSLSGTPAHVDASADSLVIRTTILELSAAGHSREEIAGYLADQLHLREPNAIIDATLGHV